MNKKEYLEAQRELDIERRLAKEKRLDTAFNTFYLAISTVLLILAYVGLYYFPKEGSMPHYLIWAIGAYTIIVLSHWTDYIDNNKK